ncbi:MAG: SRPBCC domain-containing protein [Pseudomonadota bacterium]|nr:SRPBCC domain-containing protein [Pseudomonadota bacterium]
MTNSPEPIEISRLFDAPPARVFAAWSTAERVARWFGPEGYSVPQAEVDCRPGGVFAVTMRPPDGQDSLCRGAFEEVSPPARLAFVMEVTMNGAARFKVHTTVDFVSEGAGTRMTVRQTYQLYDADYAGAPAGAREGWRTTLDKLARELARGDAATAAHGVFTIERDLPHPPAAVYRAFADPQAKARWFSGGADWTPIERAMDVRVGGREIAKGLWKSGLVTTFDAIYLDVVAGERLVYAYSLFLDERKISVSLATIEISARPDGARLKITEQGVFLDGYEDNGARERGTRAQVERIAATL